MYVHCRLKEPEPASRAAFPLFGSKFRYSGRTQYQSRNAALTAPRQAPSVDRNASKRFTGPPTSTVDTKGICIFHTHNYYVHGRIIHEAGEAEASPPGTTKIFHHFGPEISRTKNCRFVKKMAKHLTVPVTMRSKNLTNLLDSTFATRKLN